MDDGRAPAPVIADPEYRAALVAAAERLLADRTARYPALIETGRIDPGAAHAGLRTAAALAEQWRWIADPARAPLPPFCLIAGGHFGVPAGAIAADLRDAAARARLLADRSPDDADRANLAACYEALAAEQHADVVARVAWYRETNRTLHARAAADRAGEASCKAA